MASYVKPRYLVAGDKTLMVQFGNAIDPEINKLVRALAFELERRKIPGIVEWVPGYCTLMICYDPLLLPYKQLVSLLEEMEEDLANIEMPPSRVVYIPTCYGGEFGPDLDFVAQHAGLEPEQVIEIHSSVEYLVYFVGFTPGFPFLGGMPESIAAPRLPSPRAAIPAGSVGIAGKQTGIYPIESPGGWRLIGRTPLKLYDPHREEPFLLRAGDYVRFEPIDLPSYKEICSLVEQGQYSVRIGLKQNM